MAATAKRTAAPAASFAPDDTGYIVSRDGTRLYVEWFEPAAEPRGVALILHGYAEHCARYHETARVLTGCGLAVLSLDFRGHGRSDGQRGHVDRFRDYLDDMDVALLELHKRSRARWGTGRDLPVVLLAHSNGSLVALRALADPTREPLGVIGAIVSSPFLGLRMKVNPAKEAAGRIAGRVAPRLSMPNELRIEDLTHDPDKLAARRADDLCHGAATARWFVAATRAQQYVYERAMRIFVPTLWLVAGGDRIADPAQSRAVHARLRARSIYREYPGMHHEVLNEIERGRAFDEIRAFVDSLFASDPS